MGHHSGLPRAPAALADAIGHFGRLGRFATLHSPAAVAFTRELPGREPAGSSLLEDLEQDHYYRQGWFRGRLPG